MEWDNIVVDVDDFILSGFGSAWHLYLSQFAPQVTSGIWYSEQTLTTECEGLVLTGTIDLRSAEGTIEDYKVTSCWSMVFGTPEWEQQLNVYALLCEVNNIHIHSLAINAFLRDWNKNDAIKYAPKYPERPFYRLEIPLWSFEQRKQFVHERITDHLKGPRECTPEEKWQRPTTWAVIKGHNYRASRVLDSESDAHKWLNKQAKPELFHIECRPGSCRRCEDYCFCRSVCPYRGDNGTVNQST
jgi:hypothetical protein